MRGVREPLATKRIGQSRWGCEVVTAMRQGIAWTGSEKRGRAGLERRALACPVGEAEARRTDLAQAGQRGRMRGAERPPCALRWDS